MTNANVHQKLLSYFNEEDHQLIEEMKVKIKHTVILTCKNYEDCKTIVNKYKKKKFKDKDIFYHLYREMEDSTDN